MLFSVLGQICSGCCLLERKTVYFREGVTAVEEPEDCPNVSVIARKYASIFQQFLQNSDLPLWNRFNNTGFWRQLTVSIWKKFI